MLSEMRRDDDDDDNDNDAATVLGDDADEEEMGGALYRCEERAGEINKSQGLEVVKEWRRSVRQFPNVWAQRKLHTVVEPV